MSNDIQQKLANFIVSCRYELIAERLITDMKYRIIDWLGCAVIGAGYPQSTIIRQTFLHFAGCAQATVIGASGRYPVPVAALINGVIGHVAELDDGHRKAIGHPGSVTLAPALALGEAQKITGCELLQALIIGYEVYIRLGLTVNPAHYTYWHTTSTCGTFAAAATAASLLKLTPEQATHMLGIAATMAGGLVASFGTQAKALNVGLACQHGVYAAILAKTGLTGSPYALAGEKGYLQATSDARSFPWLQAFTESALLSDTAFYKVYASCGHTNSPLDAIFNLLKRQKLEAKKIARIHVETYHIAVSLTAAFKASNEDEAKFSLPYCIAVAILFGRVSLDMFKPAILASHEVRALAQKVTVAESAQATACFPERQAKVTVVMENGHRYAQSVTDSTDVTDFSMLEDKFLHATRHMDRQASEDILAFIKTLDIHHEIAPLTGYLQQIPGSSAV